MPDFAAQRLTMVETQVRPNDVTDTRIHDAMREVPRERFVPAAKRSMAYADMSVEVAPNRYLLEPRSFAKMLQLAQVRATDRVLDVGGATGYSAAVLSKLGTSVVALEQDADLLRITDDTLRSVGAHNVTVVQGALMNGDKAHAPYDVIFVNGAVGSAPDALLSQLAEGGRLVAVIRSNSQGRANLFLRQHGRVGAREDFDSAVPDLAGFRQPVGFVF
ncbi:MAG TPA: protein-L-isoaspartate O-methyltransferase [Rhizomicrobium sp.]|jgi:protein-L-isoaspartate(D-aspartate) O-methyltransferase|nr:protein-L-isoaspartate O-methyltransferase [Rhizomicrobium sp.]